MSSNRSTNIRKASPPTSGGLEPLFERLDERFFAQVSDLRLMPQWAPPRGADGGQFVNRRDGGSMEFKQHRGYGPGDDVRRVDWAVYGRTKKLFTRLVEAEHTPELIIAIDHSASMAAGGKDGKFGRALELALLLAYVALNSDYRVQLVPFGPSSDDRRDQSQSVNLIHPRQIFGYAKARLSSWGATGDTNFNRLGDQSLRWRRSGASVVVLSDFLIDVDDAAVPPNVGQPQWFRPNSEQEARFNEARTSAQNRILTSLSQLYQAFTPLRTPNVRAVLVSLTAAGEQSLLAARSIFDVETGFLQRVLFTRASEQAYQAAHRSHRIALSELAKDLGLAHVQARELNSNGANEPGHENQAAKSNRAVIENIILGLALGGYWEQNTKGDGA